MPIIFFKVKTCNKTTNAPKSKVYFFLSFKFLSSSTPPPRFLSIQNLDIVLQDTIYLLYESITNPKSFSIHFLSTHFHPHFNHHNLLLINPTQSNPIRLHRQQKHGCKPSTRASINPWCSHINHHHIIMDYMSKMEWREILLTSQINHRFLHIVHMHLLHQYFEPLSFRSYLATPSI